MIKCRDHCYYVNIQDPYEFGRLFALSRFYYNHEYDIFRVQVRTLLNIQTFTFEAKFSTNQYLPYQQINVNRTLKQYYMHKVLRVGFVRTDLSRCSSIKLSHSTSCKLSYFNGSKLTQGLTENIKLLVCIHSVRSSILLKALLQKDCDVIKTTLLHCLQP